MSMPITSPTITEHLEPVEYVPVRASGGSDAAAHEDILVFTIHDGDQVPRSLWGDRTEEILARPEVHHAYIHERDWGANQVAEHLARELGLGGYLRVNLARFILDFGRFPGTSSAGRDYLHRRCMYPPVEHLLSEEAIHQALALYYDGISQALTRHFATKRITLAVHTYDALNATGTERPKISLVTRSLEYQNRSALSPNVFDPLFPAILCEATSDRALTYQLLLDLERAGHHTALNYPYTMPEGSVEIRAQVWFFFRCLRRHFNRRFPDSAVRPEYQRVWQMLLDVTRRSPDAEQLRAYLHQYRAAPQGLEQTFGKARAAYARVREFLDTHRHSLVEGFRYAPERPSCVGIEIRKDQLCRIDSDLGTVEPHDRAHSFAREVSTIFARSVLAYVNEKNRLAEQQMEPGFEGHGERTSAEPLLGVPT